MCGLGMMCGVGVGCEWMFCGAGLCSVTRVKEKRGKKVRERERREEEREGKTIKKLFRKNGKR